LRKLKREEVLREKRSRGSAGSPPFLVVSTDYMNELNHDRQLYDTLIPPSHESPAVGLLNFMLEWIRRVNTTLYHARHPL